MPHVLSSDDLARFDAEGVLVVSQIVPPENLRAVIDAAFDFLGMDENNPADWYRLPLSPGGMIELYQHQALWDNRQNERVYGAFVDILGTPHLWSSIDRVNVKPPQNPAHPDYDHKGFMHWDSDLTRTYNKPTRVQGVLCLTDTMSDMGGFRCVPGHHKVVKEWGKETMPEPGSNARPDMSQVTPVAIPAKAGDLIIWNTLLYHGNGQNVSDRPRLAQYITMSPTPEPGSDAYNESRQKRIEAWENREPVAAHWVLGDKRHWERDHSEPAHLSSLGRKLLGLDPWE